MTSTAVRGWLIAGLALGANAGALCARQPTPRRLISVPSVEGPLVIKVVYPGPNDRVDVFDSSFVFGSVGDGRATVTINGQATRVYPNGAFLGWIRYPTESPARLQLIARRAGDSASAVLLVRRIDRYRPPSGTVWIDTTSFSPRGRVWWPRDEQLPLSVRAAADARVELVLATGKRIPFAASGAPAPIPDGIRAFDRDSMHLRRPRVGDRYDGAVRGLRSGGPLTAIVPDPNRPEPTRAATADKPLRIEAIRGRDTARAIWPLEIALLDTIPAAALLDDDPKREGGTDRTTVGRAHPGATYHWFFPNGTIAPVSGRINDDLRLQLSADLVGWVAISEAFPRSGSLVARRATVGSVTMTSLPDRISVRIPVARRVPFQVETDEREVRLVLYQSSADINWLRYGVEDSLVSLARWRQDGDRVELTVSLGLPTYGYRARWDQNDLILEIRRPPVVNRSRPLAGRKLVIDPGHPPVGSTGPTGLTEADANLSVARALVPMLESAGATVQLTRSDGKPVELGARALFADSVDADALVSIHNNALPDGIDPFLNQGSSVFYFHPQSLALARFAQQRLVEQVGIPDLGVGRADLALARPTWMPAILTEGLYLMMPDHEAFLRDSDGQRRYARAVFLALEDFFRARAASR